MVMLLPIIFASLLLQSDALSLSITEDTLIYWFKVKLNLQSKVIPLEEPTSVTVNIPTGSTAYDALELASKKKSSFHFRSKAYEKLGELIEMIDKVENSGQSKTYWMFYVNGKRSQVGVSSYKVKENDVITFKYEHIGNSALSHGSMTEDTLIYWFKVQLKLHSKVMPLDGPTSVRVNIPSGSTAYDALELASKKKSSFHFRSKAYKQMGEFIEMIDKVDNSVQSKTYWMFYVNGKLWPVGVSSYKVQEKDVITFKYEYVNN